MSRLNTVRQLDYGPNREERKLLWRPTAALHIVSDTISPGDDFDARLTSRYRHLRFTDSESGIGESLELGAYGVELIAQLVDGVRAEVDKAVEEVLKAHPIAGRFGAGNLLLHPDIRAARRTLDNKAVIV